MIFAPQVRGWIGIDLGCHSIKAAQVERRGRRYVLASAVAIQRETPRAGVDLVRSAPYSSSEELTAAFSLGDFHGRVAACNASMAVCEFSELDQDAMDVGQNGTELAHYLDSLTGPLPDGRSVDAWLSVAGDGSRGGPEQRCLTLSVSRAWASQIAADHALSGLSCRVLDGLPLCLARAVGLMERAANPTTPVAVVDWGYAEATLCVVQHGMPQFVRLLRECHLQRMLESLTQDTGASPQEAQRMLTDYGTPLRGEKPDEVQRAVACGLDDVLAQSVAEIERTFSYLRSYRRSMAPESLVLLGGGATVRGIAPFLEDHLGVPVRLWAMELADDDWRCNAPLALFGTAAALSMLRYEAS